MVFVGLALTLAQTISLSRINGALMTNHYYDLHLYVKGHVLL